MIDTEQTKLFLLMLGPPPYIFQTFTDSKAQKALHVKDPLARVLIGTFEEHDSQLKSLSAKGAGVFVQINAGRERGKAAVSQVRSLFVDIDEPDRADATLALVSKHMPKPSMLVTTSPKKYHVYWLTNDCPLDKFSIYQRHLSVKFFTDESMINLDRVMRLPGFPHQKREPYQVQVRTYNTRYGISELETYLSKLPDELFKPHDIPLPPGKVAIPPPPKTDNPFGIDIGDGYEAPEELPPGDRTHRLIRHIGWMVQQGYDEPDIRQEIMKMNIDLCPVGSAPIPPRTLEAEVLGCITKFIDKRNAEIAAVHGPAFVEAQKVADIIPPPPPPPAVAALMDQPEIPQDTLSAWLARFIYIVDRKRVADSTVHGEWAIMTWEEFEKANAGKKASKTMNLSTAWLRAKERLTVRGVSYRPCGDPIITDQSDQRFFNTYQPAAVIPAVSIDANKISVFMEHIIYLFPRESDRDAFLGWFCYTVSNPLKTVTWAPVLVSRQGTGKGWILEVMKKLMGETNVKPITPDRIENQFNSFLFSSTLVCVYDMFKSKDRTLDGKLKGYIDVTETEANKKGVGERTEKVYANFLLFANSSDSIFIEPGDRRFWMVELPPPREPNYYNNLFAWLEEDSNFPHLLSWCHQYKSNNFSPTHPPSSELKQDVMQRNKPEIQLELESCIEERLGPFACDVLTFETVRTYMERTLDVDIKGSARVALSQVWGAVSSTLKVERVNIEIGSRSSRQRVRCVRNVSKWDKKHSREVSEEASRAANLVLNPAGGKLKLGTVKNDQSSGRGDSG